MRDVPQAIEIENIELLGKSILLNGQDLSSHADGTVLGDSCGDFTIVAEGNGSSHLKDIIDAMLVERKTVRLVLRDWHQLSTLKKTLFSRDYLIYLEYISPPSRSSHVGNMNWTPPIGDIELHNLGSLSTDLLERVRELAYFSMIHPILWSLPREERASLRRIHEQALETTIAQSGIVLKREAACLAYFAWSKRKIFTKLDTISITYILGERCLSQERKILKDWFFSEISKAGLPLIANVHIDNIASTEVLLKQGFVLFGARIIKVSNA